MSGGFEQKLPSVVLSLNLQNRRLRRHFLRPPGEYRLQRQFRKPPPSVALLLNKKKFGVPWAPHLGVGGGKKDIINFELPMAPTLRAFGAKNGLKSSAGS